jgi:hypothetical protein
MPDEVIPRTVEMAELALAYGLSSAHATPEALRNITQNRQNDRNYRRNNRWGGDPIVGMLSDFDPLLSVLFSEHTDAAIQLLKAFRENPVGSTIPQPPETRLDRVKQVWERALPHRELVLRGSTIEARPAGGGVTYKASAMSDGERVAFYLIAHALVAPIGSIIVVDEPEVHLHRAIQAQLWNEIEQERGDCLFVYITHDLEFAASRAGAVKIWLSGYDNGTWKWEQLPDSRDGSGIPEEVLLTVLGSRKPVLFVEGDRGSLEQAIFARVYPTWTVVPRGGCDAVISAVTAFRSLQDRHRFQCCGVVDRDYRSDSAVQALAEKGVHVLSVHEIENVLLAEDVLRAIATHLAIAEPNTVVDQVKEWVFGQLAADRPRAASAATAARIEESLRVFDAKAQGEVALRDAVARLVANVDVTALYAEAANNIDNAIGGRDYRRALQLYANKGLVKQVDRFFGLGGGGYVQLVLRLLGRPEGGPLIRALAAVTPTLAPQSPV